MTWLIMRRDYSAVLLDKSKGLIAWSSKEHCEIMAYRFGGVCVPTKVAKKILTINRMIGRKD